MRRGWLHLEEDRRDRGDLIGTYKILTGKSDVDFGSVTGYLNLVVPPPPKTELRKNFYTYRVVPMWNQLPDHMKAVQTTKCCL